VEIHRRLPLSFGLFRKCEEPELKSIVPLFAPRITTYYPQLFLGRSATTAWADFPSEAILIPQLLYPRAGLSGLRSDAQQNRLQPRYCAENDFFWGSPRYAQAFGRGGICSFSTRNGTAEEASLRALHEEKRVISLCTIS